MSEDAKVVVVVGGSSGIGLAAALEHARRGDRVILASRSSAALDAAAVQCRSVGARSVRSVVTDIAEPADVDDLVRTALDYHGRIDVVVLTAAVMAYGDIVQVPADVFERVVGADIFGTAHVARAILPAFRAQGHGVLIVVNSLLGSVTVPGLSAYPAGNWGQRALLGTLQQETLGDERIRLCIVSPDSVNTPIYYQAATVVGRAARPPWPVRQPEDAARVIADLAGRPRRHVFVRVGYGNPLIVTAFRLAPRLYDRSVGPLFRALGLSRKIAARTDGNVRKPVAERERVRGHWPDPR